MQQWQHYRLSRVVIVHVLFCYFPSTYVDTCARAYTMHTRIVVLYLGFRTKEAVFHLLNRSSLAVDGIVIVNSTEVVCGIGKKRMPMLCIFF